MMSPDGGAKTANITLTYVMRHDVAAFGQQYGYKYDLTAGRGWLPQKLARDLP
jgi:hypothetical protein